MEKLKFLIHEFGLMFGKELKPEMIDAYCKFLINFDYEKINYALTNIIKKGNKFFPTCAEIYAEIDPQLSSEDTAIIKVNNIISIARKYGYGNNEKGFSMLDEIETKALKLFGGFESIGQSENMEITRSQLTRLIKALVESGKNKFYYDEGKNAVDCGKINLLE
jgi:hypothetical protein